MDDRKRVRIFATPVQEVPLTLFDRLGENDILFLDTSHIAKTGSGGTFELFEILRRLKPGTIVHIHDIPYPFEYSREWVYAQRGYNEAYFVRAFLMLQRRLSDRAVFQPLDPNRSPMVPATHASLLAKLRRRPLAQQAVDGDPKIRRGNPDFHPRWVPCYVKATRSPRTTPLQPAPRRTPSRLRHPREAQ